MAGKGTGGEGEREKFTGEWVDATRPSNRCLDYSAWRIGIRVNVYCVRVHVCVRFFPLVLSSFSARNIVYLYFPPTSLPLLLSYRSIPLFFLPLIWFFFVWFLRGTDRDPQLSRVDRVRKRVADG